MKKQYIWSILVFLIVIVSFIPVFAVTNTLETSVVSLIVKSNQEIIGKDNYFELIDFNEYQLVPLNSLTSWLDLEIDFNREKNRLTVYSMRFNRKVQVYLNEQLYMVEEKSEWQAQPPVALNGNFYASPLLIEYVAQVKVFWDSRYQELTIQGDWLSPKMANNPKLDTKIETNIHNNEKALEGPAFSLGTIAYELSWKNQQDTSGNDTSTQTLGIRSDGRAGPWTISLSGDLACDNLKQDIDPALTLIRAKYNENNQLIILGDSDLRLDETLGSKDLRGFLWMTPNLLQSKKLLIYTTVSGVADPGDKVKLLVNGQLISELTVREGNSYVFAKVPLKLKRMNVIKVLITKNNGETVETCKKIAASPRMLEHGTYDYLLACGKYRQVSSNSGGNNLSSENAATLPWEGDVTAVKADYGINDYITFHSEITRIRASSFNGQGAKIIDGADLGVAFRFGAGTIYTLDWLTGGEESHDLVKRGWNSSLLYEMENGSIEAVMFYVPDEVGKGLRNVSAGKGIQILGELDFSNNVTFIINGNLIESLLTPGNSNGEIKFKLNRHSSGEIQIDNTVTATKKSMDTLSQGQNYLNLSFDHLKKGKRFSSKESLGFSNLDLWDEQLYKNFKHLSFDENMLNSINNSLLVGFSFSPTANWWDNNYHDLSVSTECQVKWNHKNTYVSLKGSATGTYGAGSGSGFLIDTSELNGNAQYYLTNSWNGYLKFSRVIQNLDNYSYATGAVGFSYQWPQSGGKIWADIGYFSPMNGQIEPQWAPSFGVSRVFKSGFELILESRRNYKSQWSNSYEQVYQMSFRQALGFGNGRVHSFAYSTNENLAAIGGAVYLDENGNGQRDPGERGLADIKIMLDGNMAETNSEGDYLFSSVDPGIYRVNFDFNSLPADYTPVTGEQLVKVKQSENMFLDFGVTINGCINGKAFVDSNANGRMDPGEEPLAWAGILLDGNKKYFTLQDGEFYIENVPLGTHTISIIQETVPVGMEVKGDREFQVKVSEEELDVNDILFPVVFEFKE